jgi:hypothetical protein
LGSSTVGRLEILTWFSKYCGVLTATPSPGELAQTLVSCIQDKTATVRAAAEQCLGSLIKAGLLSRQAVDVAMRDLSPAAKRTLEPLVARMLESAKAANGAIQYFVLHFDSTRMCFEL